MFGFTIVIAPNGTIHVKRPYAQHFTREDPGGFWAKRRPDRPRPLGHAGYCMNRKGRLLYGY